MPSSSLTCPSRCFHHKMAPCLIKCRVKWTLSTRRLTRQSSRYLSCKQRAGSMAWISNHRPAWPTAVNRRQTQYFKMTAHRKERSSKSTEWIWVHPKRSSCSIKDQVSMISLRAYDLPRDRPALVLIKTRRILHSTIVISRLKLSMAIRALCHNNLN